MASLIRIRYRPGHPLHICQTFPEDDTREAQCARSKLCRLDEDGVILDQPFVLSSAVIVHHELDPPGSSYLGITIWTILLNVALSFLVVHELHV